MWSSKSKNVHSNQTLSKLAYDALKYLCLGQNNLYGVLVEAGADENMVDVVSTICRQGFAGIQKQHFCCCGNFAEI